MAPHEVGWLTFDVPVLVVLAASETLFFFFCPAAAAAGLADSMSVSKLGAEDIRSRLRNLLVVDHTMQTSGRFRTWEYLHGISFKFLFDT